VQLRGMSASTTRDAFLDFGHTTSSLVVVAEMLGATTRATALQQRLWARVSNNHELKSQLNSFV
jgi:hypothetical protein